MKSLAWEEMGRTFGCSAEAVRKRVSRILDRLGSMLRGRGIALPAGALLGVVASQSCAGNVSFALHRDRRRRRG